jgi:hypothetical protein
MATTYNDMYWLSQDPGFQHRVQMAFLDRCFVNSAEGFTVAFHRERQRFVTQALSSPQALANQVTLVSFSVATDSNVIGDATVGGTVHPIDAATAATAGLLVTDAHLASAIAGQFNQYSMQPDN